MMQPTSSRPRLLASGLDSLYVAYSVETSQSGLDWDDLGFRRESLKRQRHADFAAIELGGERFALKPYGRKPYSFVLTNADFEISLSEHMQPRCYVQFFSEGLWKSGLDTMLARIETWLASMGFRATRPNTVSRADWAFDYDLPSVDFRPEHFVTRADKAGTWSDRGELQTILLGIGDIVVRVYDKVAEIAQQSGKVWFNEIWGQTADVWRIEFQVRGARLKAGGIHTTDDLKALQNDLLRELAGGHTTLRRPSGDSNRSRWPWHPLWRALNDDIAALPQTGLVRALDPQMPLHWRLHQQSKSLYGNFKGLAAVIALIEGRTEPPELDEVIESLPDLLKPHHANDNWHHEVGKRITAHGLGQW
jgi:hypothetical protein